MKDLLIRLSGACSLTGEKECENVIKIYRLGDRWFALGMRETCGYKKKIKVPSRWDVRITRDHPGLWIRGDLRLVPVHKSGLLTISMIEK